MAKTKIVLVSIGWTLVKDRLGCVYFPSYSLKWVSCFMLKQLMMSWYLNIWKFKIWLSQEWKELSKWKKNFFLLVSQVLSFKHTRQTKNVADATFKSIVYFNIYLYLNWHSLDTKVNLRMSISWICTWGKLECHNLYIVSAWFFWDNFWPWVLLPHSVPPAPYVAFTNTIVFYWHFLQFLRYIFSSFWLWNPRKIDCLQSCSNLVHFVFLMYLKCGFQNIKWLTLSLYLTRKNSGLFFLVTKQHKICGSTFLDNFNLQGN